MKNKIVWNKVTWYSKTLAAVIFIILPLVAFYLGIKLGYFIGSEPAQINIYIARNAADTVLKYADADLGYSIDYPANWTLDPNATSGAIVAFKPASGTSEVRVFLQKNSYKDIYALKSAVDKRIGSGANATVKHGSSFDALYYGKVNGSAVMYVPMTKDYVLGIAGPDTTATWGVFNSFAKL